MERLSAPVQIWNNLQQLQKNTFEENLEDSSHLMRLFKKIYTLEKVVIAEIQGHAIAGGCGLANVCDFSFAVPEASFGYTEVKIGFVPAIVMVFLLRKLGEGKAKALMLSGDIIPAAQARDLGMVNQVVPAEALSARVQEFANQLIFKNSADSLKLTKQMMANVQEMSLDQALEHAAKVNATARETPDCRRGIQAFLDKEELLW